MVQLVILPMVPLVANGTNCTIGRVNGTIGIAIGTNGITNGTIGQNQNSLLVERQNDNTSPGGWPRKISP